MDNEIDRKIDMTAILFLLVQNRQQTHDWTLIGSGATGVCVMSQHVMSQHVMSQQLLSILPLFFLFNVILYDFAIKETS